MTKDPDHVCLHCPRPSVWICLWCCLQCDLVHPFRPFFHRLSSKFCHGSKLSFASFAPRPWSNCHGNCLDWTCVGTHCGNSTQIYLVDTLRFWARRLWATLAFRAWSVCTKLLKSRWGPLLLATWHSYKGCSSIFRFLHWWNCLSWKCGLSI